MLGGRQGPIRDSENKSVQEQKRVQDSLIENGWGKKTAANLFWPQANAIAYAV